ncbi:hypothetical protein TNCV_4241542 [Trichonephila clavipes]|nr:hypothetical protein TNCV_4241542 [Trichonephila clavipes]
MHSGTPLKECEFCELFGNMDSDIDFEAQVQRCPVSTRHARRICVLETPRGRTTSTPRSARPPLKSRVSPLPSPPLLPPPGQHPTCGQCQMLSAEGILGDGTGREDTPSIRVARV